MIRINIPWIVEVAAALDRLNEVQKGMTFSEGWLPLFNAKQQVELLSMSVYSQHIRVSRQKAASLVSTLERFLERPNSQHVDELDQWTLRNERDRFREVFLAEISSMPAYLVARKESYDVDVLIDSGTSLFPPTLILKAPETEKDALESGRALAFELPTACGFHLFRVTEAVVKRYWDEVSGGKSRPKLQTLGNFASEMEKMKIGDEKVVESIKQMTRLHRNPIAHPEVILSVEEAIGIVGMARSVVGSMLSVMPDVPTTTGAPSS